MDITTALKQIGASNFLAISGGRITRNDDNFVLPVSNGYAVRVSLAWDDTYTVTREFRGIVRGIVSGVYADELGETAYQASNFRNGSWGDL